MTMNIHNNNHAVHSHAHNHNSAVQQAGAMEDFSLEKPSDKLSLSEAVETFRDGFKQLSKGEKKLHISTIKQFAEMSQDHVDNDMKALHTAANKLMDNPMVLSYIDQNGRSAQQMQNGEGVIGKRSQSFYDPLINDAKALEYVKEHGKLPEGYCYKGPDQAPSEASMTHDSNTHSNNVDNNNSANNNAPQTDNHNSHDSHNKVDQGPASVSNQPVVVNPSPAETQSAVKTEAVALSETENLVTQTLGIDSGEAINSSTPFAAGNLNVFTQSAFKAEQYAGYFSSIVNSQAQTGDLVALSDGKIASVSINQKTSDTSAVISARVLPGLPDQNGLPMNFQDLQKSGSEFITGTVDFAAGSYLISSAGDLNSGLSVSNVKSSMDAESGQNILNAFTVNIQGQGGSASQITGSRNAEGVLSGHVKTDLNGDSFHEVSANIQGGIVKGAASAVEVEVLVDNVDGVADGNLDLFERGTFPVGIAPQSAQVPTQAPVAGTSPASPDAPLDTPLDTPLEVPTTIPDNLVANSGADVQEAAVPSEAPADIADIQPMPTTETTETTETSEAVTLGTIPDSFLRNPGAMAPTMLPTTIAQPAMDHSEHAVHNHG